MAGREPKELHKGDKRDQRRKEDGPSGEGDNSPAR